MDNKIAKMLAECLEWISREGATASQAASRYPKYQEELTDLLETIEHLSKNAAAAPRPEFQAAARTRMENKISARSQNLTVKENVTFSRPIRHNDRITKNTGLRRLSMSWLIVLITAASLVLGGGGVAYASADALPGDGLYPVKTLVQDVGLALSSDAGDIDLLVGFLNENIDELNQLADQGRWDDLEEGLDQYQENMDALTQTRSRLSYLDAPSEDALNTRLQQELHNQSEELLKLQTKLQAQVKLQEKVQEAIQLTDQGKVYGPSAGEKPEEPGTPNGVGPGEPQGTQDQQGTQPGDPQDGQGQQGNKNGQAGEDDDPADLCRPSEDEELYDENGEIIFGEDGEELPICDAPGNQGEGKGNGSGGKP